MSVKPLFHHKILEEGMPPRAATIEHIYSKWDVRRHLKNPVVAVCYKCNQDKAALDEKRALQGYYSWKRYDGLLINYLKCHYNIPIQFPPEEELEKEEREIEKPYIPKKDRVFGSSPSIDIYPLLEDKRKEIHKLLNFGSTWVVGKGLKEHLETSMKILLPNNIKRKIQYRFEYNKEGEYKHIFRQRSNPENYIVWT